MATTVNMHEAKTHFSKLVQRALLGEEVIVAKAGKAVIRLEPVRVEARGSWMGCLAGRGYAVPEDFNEMGREELEQMFYGDPDVAQRSAMKSKKRTKASKTSKAKRAQ